MKILTSVVGATALLVASGCSSTPTTPSKAQVRSPLAKFYSPAPAPTPVQYEFQTRDDPRATKSTKSAYPSTRASVGDRLANDESSPAWRLCGIECEWRR